MFSFPFPKKIPDKEVPIKSLGFWVFVTPFGRSFKGTASLLGFLTRASHCLQIPPRICPLKVPQKLKKFNRYFLKRGMTDNF